MAGAFRATPIRELEAETFTPPLDVYCSELRARHIRRTYSSPVGTFIKEQCRMISSRLRRRGPQRLLHRLCRSSRRSSTGRSGERGRSEPTARRLYSKNGTGNGILDNAGAAGVAWPLLKRRARAGLSCIGSSRRPRALFWFRLVREE